MCPELPVDVNELWQVMPAMAERRGWPAAVSLQGRQIVAVDVVASILNNREPRDMELSTTPGHQPLFFTIVFGKRDFVPPQKLLEYCHEFDTCLRCEAASDSFTLRS